MKHYTILLLSVLTALPAFSSPASPKLLKLLCPKNKTEIRQEQKAPSKFASPESSKTIWKPGKSDTFIYNSGGWDKDYTTTYTYRPDGLIKEELMESISYKEKTVYEYDSEGRLISETVLREDGSSFVNGTRTEYTYDEITGATTSIINYSWDESENAWKTSYLSSKIEIERNGDNNVVSVKEYSTLFGSEFYLFYTMNISYNSEGIADKIELIDPDGLHLTMSDIVWIETDGQIIMGESEMFLGNNKLSSCKINGEEEGITFDGEMTFEYGDGNDYKCVSRMGSIIAIQSHEESDGNGSYKDTLHNYIDINSNGEMEDEEIIYTEITEMRYNDNKLITLDYYFEEDRSEEPSYSNLDVTKYDYTYDGTYGIPSEVIISSMDETATDYQPVNKITYYDFIDVANGGIAKTAASCDLTVEVNGDILECRGNGIESCTVYDTSGRTVINVKAEDSNTIIDISSLQPGIYILQAKSKDNQQTAKFIKR